MICALYSGLEKLMLAAANRGEVNTAFLLLAQLSETATSQENPRRNERNLLKHVIISGQVSTLSLDV